MRPGELLWIGIRPTRKDPMLKANSALLIASKGIKGDHCDTQQNGPRQVTLIAAEDMTAVASFLGKGEVAPEAIQS